MTTAATTTEKAGTANRSRQSRRREEILLALLNRISGDKAEDLVVRLLEAPEKLEAVAREIGASPSVEALRKLGTTLNIMKSGRLEADYAYVGLPDEARACGFREGFETFMRSRLGKRADSFALMFEHLDRHRDPLIIETGCLRVPNNWEGDGQSTFQFDCYAREKNGSVITIDINPDSIDSARRACSGVTQTILNDSVSALDMLSARMTGPAALIYLDSFDLDMKDPMPSAVHHALEIMAVRSLIGPGTLICVDDFNVPPLGPGGKGLIVDQFLHNIRAEVLYSGYQKLWRMPG